MVLPEPGAPMNDVPRQVVKAVAVCAVCCLSVATAFSNRSRSFTASSDGRACSAFGRAATAARNLSLAR